MQYGPVGMSDGQTELGVTFPCPTWVLGGLGVAWWPPAAPDSCTLMKFIYAENSL